MIVYKLPYILFRKYPNFGYLTDNRNFGYDTATKSSLKVGDMLLSSIGSVFYSTLSEDPRTIDEIVEQLCVFFSNTPASVIRKDCIAFFTKLHTEGFVYCGETVDVPYLKSCYFSYDKVQPHENGYTKREASQAIYEKTFGDTPRLTRVHLDISSRCNERCVHCYIPDYKKCSIMRVGVFDRILSQCREMNVLNITISGGEPMLNPHLGQFLLKCRDANFSVNLLSNLTLLTNELLDIIAANPLVSVQTSLYAMDENVHDTITQKHGSFRKTIRSLNKLHDRNIPLQINCPVMKHNLKSYKDVMTYAKSKNIEADFDCSLYGSYDLSKSNISCRLNSNDINDVISFELSSKENHERVLRQAQDKKVGANDPICQICKNSLCFSNNGDVYPCEGWQSLKLGNIMDQSLDEIWIKSAMTNKLRELTYENFPRCNSCADKSYCNTCLILNANEDARGDYKNINTFQCEVAKIKHRQCLLRSGLKR